MVDQCLKTAQEEELNLSHIIKYFKVSNIDNTLQVIGEKMLPHVEGAPSKKALYLCFMAN